MESQDWLDVIDQDLPEYGKVTTKTIHRTLDEARRYRGSVRMSTGRIWTSQGFEDRRNKVLSQPLP